MAFPTTGLYNTPVGSPQEPSGQKSQLVFRLRTPFAWFLLGFPMKTSGLMSIYGGLVPLGFPHSNVRCGFILFICRVSLSYPRKKGNHFFQTPCFSQIEVLCYKCCRGKQVQVLYESVAVRRFILPFLPGCRNLGTRPLGLLRRPGGNVPSRNIRAANFLSELRKPTRDQIKRSKAK